MNMYTVPNQKVVRVNKKPCQSDYMTIQNSDWMNAFITLKRASYGIYQYIASNVDGYTFALSRTDVMDKLKIGKDSYIRGVKELVDKGYLLEDEEGNYQFYTSPACLEAYTDDGVYAQKHTQCMPTSVHGVCMEAYTGVCSEAYSNSKNSNNSNSNNKNVADAPATTSADAQSSNIVKNKNDDMDEHDFVYSLSDEEFWAFRDRFFKNQKFIPYKAINSYMKKNYKINWFNDDILNDEVNRRLKDIQNQKIKEDIERANDDYVEYFDDDEPDDGLTVSDLSLEQCIEVLDGYKRNKQNPFELNKYLDSLVETHGLSKTVVHDWCFEFDLKQRVA